MKPSHYWLLVLLLASTAGLILSRKDRDRVPSSEPLSRLPHSIGTWNGRDFPIDPETIAVLGRGDFLSRAYAEPDAAMPVTLFIGYFPTQRTGQTIHSPKHCLPGAGWTFDSASDATIRATNEESYRVGEYVVSNGELRQFVIYWYQAHGRSTPSEYLAKVHLVLDAIRMNRTDGALIRVMTPIGSYETVATAQDRAVRFTSQLAPYLGTFIPH